MAEYVDALYGENQDYLKETKFILSIFKKHKIKPELIYDVACGSGRHSNLLKEKGYAVVGIDLNEGMLKLARESFPDITFLKQNMTKLSMKKKADCIITMFNAVNHLKNHFEFENMLRAYSKNLNEKGLVIFDTMWDPNNWVDGHFSAKKTKINNSIIVKADSSFQLDKNKGFVRQVYIVWEGKNKKAKIMETTYTNFLFDITKIKSISKKCGFKVHTYYDFSLTAKKRKNCRYVFVLEKIK